MQLNFKLGKSMLRFHHLSFFIFAATISYNAHAQNFSFNNAQLPERSMQDGSGAAHLQAEFSQMQDQMRVLQGQLDELRNSLKQFENYLKIFNGDINARFEALEKSKAGPVGQNILIPTDAPAGIQGLTQAQPLQEGLNQGLPYIPEVVNPADQSSFLTKPGHESGLSDGDAQRKYAYAHQLLQEKNHLGAEATLKDLIQKYPDDPLIVNARYWLAEIYFVKRDYATAAVEFGEAFEAYQRFNKGDNASKVSSKAPEILLKMALSLKGLGNIKDAKLILAKIKKSFPHMTADVKLQVDALSNELGSK